LNYDLSVHVSCADSVDYGAGESEVWSIAGLERLETLFLIVRYTVRIVSTDSLQAFEQFMVIRVSIFDFDENADSVFGEVERLVKGWDGFAFEFRGEPASGVSPANFVGRGIRDGTFQIGGAIKCIVVNYDDFAVRGKGTVELKVVGSHILRESKRGEGIFGSVSACASVGDDGAVLFNWVHGTFGCKSSIESVSIDDV
jgi:hypothetical protein